MVSIKWCCKQKDGIKLIEPNENLSSGYLKMAEDALGTMVREKEFSLRFSISAGYYSMYYSAYSILMKLGIKSEIHSCTLEFLKEFLLSYYSSEDITNIKKAFECRNNIQYYVDKVINQQDFELILTSAPLFYNKSKLIISQLNESEIKQIRDKLSLMLNL